MTQDIFSQLQLQSETPDRFTPLDDEYALKPWQIFMSLVALGVIGAASVPGIQGQMAEGRAVAQSSEALQRVRQNAYRGVNAQRQEVAFEEGMTVYDASTMQPITSEGAVVTNKRCDTGVIRSGTLSDVRRVATKDLGECRNVLKLNEQGRTAPGV